MIVFVFVICSVTYFNNDFLKTVQMSEVIKIVQHIKQDTSQILDISLKLGDFNR